ncbi:DUF1045 domain-containing protein [Sedimentitalea sp. HM32M-2]|uniref:DUF1045 domain-containing protein n=1 Tax=Sedimentitalea sp. HM32M-2 TaxID=3351566 RepID=UPI00363D3581
MFKRYAIYVAPGGALGRFGAAWLGWDIHGGRTCAPPPGLGLDPAPLTRRPRRYGLHATIKPPFRLAPGTEASDLGASLTALAGDLAPVPLAGLHLGRMGRFLALMPVGDQAAISGLAARVVRDLDRFRAAPDAAELARRRPDRLSPEQRQNLYDWGYPHVMGQFRFHITLTGPLDPVTAARAQAALTPHLAPLLTGPYVVKALTLAGEDAEGRFHAIRSCPLVAGR